MVRPIALGKTIQARAAAFGEPRIEERELCVGSCREAVHGGTYGSCNPAPHRRMHNLDGKWGAGQVISNFVTCTRQVIGLEGKNTLATYR